MKSNISQARISQEIRTMRKENLPYLKAEPLDDDIYNWHFTFLGPQNSDFHEGLYHGQILLPFQYPFKPPDIIFMNKNGRFQVNTKICLTITQYHPQQWNSAWTIRTMLEAVISLFTENVHGVGYQESNSESRKYMAKQSHNFTCEKCGVLKNILKPRQQQKAQNIKKQQKESKQQIKLQSGHYEYAPQTIRKKSQQIILHIREVPEISIQNRKYSSRQNNQTEMNLQSKQIKNNLLRKNNGIKGFQQEIQPNKGQKNGSNSINKDFKNSNYQNGQVQTCYVIQNPKDIFNLNNKINRNRELTRNILQSGKWLSGVRKNTNLS